VREPQNAIPLPTTAIPFTTPPAAKPDGAPVAPPSSAAADASVRELLPTDPPEPETTAASAPAAPPAEKAAADLAAPPAQTAGRFGPLPDANADIPSFARYLPAFRQEEAERQKTEDDRRETEEAAPPATSYALHPAPTVTPTRRTPRTRARHARNIRPENVPSGLSAAELWATVPKHVQTLLALERLEEEKEIAQHSYKRPFQEKRQELIERLLDPVLSLEDTARLLNVCPTTVRRYTNKGILTYYRKEPEHSTKSPDAEKETRQRRFRLSDILAFLETQQAAIETDRRVERKAARDSRLAALPDAGQE
jgi:hypothetical protein